MRATAAETVTPAIDKFSNILALDIIVYSTTQLPNPMGFPSESGINF
ncbi:hypothetical protein SPLC1_S203910 [Arthrospira platensis C1]|nr:hypothetical protein SPLC1_S203910 [Arthrospira platensis C1]